MGIASFGRNQASDSGEAAAASPAGPDEGSEGAPLQIHHGCEFEGKLVVGHSIQIDGEVKGEIESAGTVTISEGADVVADIRAKNIIIRGAVAGNVRATRELHIVKSGRLQGDVQAAALHIEKGAVFNGHMEMVRPDHERREAWARSRARRSDPAAGRPAPFAPGPR